MVELKPPRRGRLQPVLQRLPSIRGQAEPGRTNVIARWGGTVDRIAFDAPYEHDSGIWPAVIADIKRRA